MTENNDGTVDVETLKNNFTISKSRKYSSDAVNKKISSLNDKEAKANAENAANGLLLSNQAPDSQNTAPMLDLSSNIAPLSLTQYEDYIINGRNMNSLAASVWAVAIGSDRFVRYSSTNLTATQIQDFFVSKNSILKNQIQIWAKNTSGVVYDTGRSVYPNQVIDTASKNWSINPKVIIATMQKEQSLVTGSFSNNSSHFYGAMGYGDCYGTDSGFDTQVDRGTHLFLTLWNAGYSKGQSAFPYLMKKGTFYDQYASLNNDQNITYSGVTYKNYIWVKDCGTYALYSYTPWTSTFSGGFDSGNYLFLTCMRTYWPGNYNGVDWN